MTEPDPPSEDHVARNEAHFRAVNERIADQVEGAARSTAVGFVCECGWPDCRRLVDLAPPEYAAVRARPRRFFVVPGHELPDVEEVVDRVEDRYLVVEKPPELRAVLEQADARERPDG